MNRKLIPALLLLASVPCLSACGREDAATGTEAGVFAEVSSELRKEMKQVSTEVRQELATENIDISDSDDGSDAEITPKGDLLVNGQQVEITAEQRALLLQYREHIANIAVTGASIGMQGASLATSAMSKAFSGVLGGDTEQMEKEIEAEAKKIAQQAQKICELMPAMLETEQQLAASLPEFRPYADMTQADIDDCNAGITVN